MPGPRRDATLVEAQADAFRRLAAQIEVLGPPVDERVAAHAEDGAA